MALLLFCLAATSVAAQAQRMPQSRGLWIGPIPACAGTVASVTVEMDIMGQPQAVAVFRPAWRAALLRETRRRLNRPMPVRLDGRTFMAPIVREPIAGGKVTLSGLAAREAERIRAAALRPCPRGR